jgi:hypothetical protein
VNGHILGKSSTPPIHLIARQNELGNIKTADLSRCVLKVARKTSSYQYYYVAVKPYEALIGIGLAVFLAGAGLLVFGLVAKRGLSQASRTIILNNCAS